MSKEKQVKYKKIKVGALVALPKYKTHGFVVDADGKGKSRDYIVRTYQGKKVGFADDIFYAEEVMEVALVHFPFM